MRLPLFALAVALLPSAAPAAPVLDQEFWSSRSALVAASVGVFRRAMTFTPGFEGLLARIEVATFAPPAAGSTLALLGTLGGVPGGAPLAVGTLIESVGEVSSFAFTGFAQSAGEALAIELLGSGTSWVASGNLYARGEEFSWFPPAGQTGFTPSGIDLFFRTYAVATAVPAPAGALALGLVALLALRHKNCTG